MSNVTSAWFAVGMNQHMVRRPSIEECIDQYRPRTLDLYQWIECAEFVRDVVRRSAPPEPEEARRRMTLVSGLVGWAHGVCGHPLTVEAMLHHGVIGEYSESGQRGMSKKVRSQNRAKLKAIARSVNPHWPDDLPQETAYTSAWRPNPYNEAEITALAGWADGQRTPGRRIKAKVLLALCLGGGLYSHEVARLRVRDIEVDDEGVVLHVRGPNPRDVPVMARWEAILIELKANVPDSEYAFSPGRTNRKTSVIHGFVQSTNMDGVRDWPTPQRMRAAWIVDHIRAGVPAAVLARAAGITNLRSFERWVFEFPEITPAQYRAWLRGKGDR